MLTIKMKALMMILLMTCVKADDNYGDHNLN